jgi:hypothetical protein
LFIRNPLATDGGGDLFTMSQRKNSVIQEGRPTFFAWAKKLLLSTRDMLFSKKSLT